MRSIGELEMTNMYARLSTVRNLVN